MSSIPHGRNGPKYQAGCLVVFAVFLAVALLIGIGSVNAQQRPPNCGPRLAIIKLLATKYKEAPKFIAIAAKENLIEIFISKAGTWTVLITTPQKQTCVIAAGDSWEALPPVTILDPEI